MNDKLRVLTSAQLKKAYGAKGSELKSLDIDPDGIHLAKPFMLTGQQDSDIRCQMFIKVVGQEQPVEHLLDIPLADYRNLITLQAFRRYQGD